jgi:hypothetical protein
VGQPGRPLSGRAAAKPTRALRQTLSGLPQLITVASAELNAVSHWARDLGGTVLLHDSDGTCPPGSARGALGALPMLLDECAQRDLRVGPLAEHWAVPPGAARRAGGGAAS